MASVNGLFRKGPSALFRSGRASLTRFKAVFAVLAALMCAMLAHPSSLLAGQALTVLTEEFPPFNFSENGRLGGISTEVLELVLKDAGFSLAASDFKVLPWARAYNEVLTTPGTLLYSVTRTPERESLFCWVGPIAPNRNVLMARKSRGIRIETFSDVARYKVGAIRDDAGEQLLLARGFPRQKLDSSIDAKSNLFKLDSGRIDIFAYPETVFRWVAAQAGRNSSDYEPAFVLHDGHVYFALHRDTPEELVQRLQDALDRLKESGKVQAVIDRYLN